MLLDNRGTTTLSGGTFISHNANPEAATGLWNYGAALNIGSGVTLVNCSVIYLKAS